MAYEDEGEMMGGAAMLGQSMYQERLTIDDLTMDSPLAMEDEALLQEMAENPVEEAAPSIGSWPTPEIGSGGSEMGMPPMQSGGEYSGGGSGEMGVPQGAERDQEQVAQEMAEVLRQKAAERQQASQQFQSQGGQPGEDEGFNGGGWYGA